MAVPARPSRLSYDIPYGNYPLTDEVALTWGTGISRSWVPIALWNPSCSWCWRRRAGSPCATSRSPERWPGSPPPPWCHPAAGPPAERAADGPSGAHLAGLCDRPGHGGTAAAGVARAGRAGHGPRRRHEALLRTDGGGGPWRGGLPRPRSPSATSRVARAAFAGAFVVGGIWYLRNTIQPARRCGRLHPGRGATRRRASSLSSTRRSSSVRRPRSTAGSVSTRRASVGPGWCSAGALLAARRRPALAARRMRPGRRGHVDARRAWHLVHRVGHRPRKTRRSSLCGVTSRFRTFATCCPGLARRSSRWGSPRGFAARSAWGRSRCWRRPSHGASCQRAPQDPRGTPPAGTLVLGALAGVGLLRSGRSRGGGGPDAAAGRRVSFPRAATPVLTAVAVGLLLVLVADGFIERHRTRRSPPPTAWRSSAGSSTSQASRTRARSRSRPGASSHSWPAIASSTGSSSSPSGPPARRWRRSHGGGACSSPIRPSSAVTSAWCPTPRRAASPAAGRYSRMPTSTLCTGTPT